MKAVYIYNQHSAHECEMLERAKQEMGAYIQEVQVLDIDQAKELYHFGSTPAIIFVQEHLQGAHLLDSTDGQLRVTAEVYKALQDEELNLRNAETHRIDYLITAEVNEKVDSAVMEMLERGV